jgi:catechol 2,3-dioxygenase-like lactoylglutathione lyase family enzyme
MSPPSPTHVLETGLYARDLEAVEEFYGQVLGLGVLFREEGRHVFFRCGPGTVLLFNSEVTRAGKTLPPHGTEGDGHVAFAVAPERLDAWRRHLHRHEIAVEHEEEWGEGQRSLYVRDPAGNSVELATTNLWGTAGRDDRLRGARPGLDVEIDEASPVERLQHETLRPVLKLLNPTLLRLVTARVRRYGVKLGKMDRGDRQKRLRNLLKQDDQFKQTLLGMVVGHLTEEELDVYLEHEGEVRRRCASMLLARVLDQTDEIAGRVEGERGR